MKRMRLAMVGCVIGLTGCSMGSDDQPSLPENAQWQAVDNTALLQHVDERLAGMSAVQKLHYLALQGCAAEIGMMGIYGSVDDNPLMQRWNELNDRYNNIWKEVQTVLQLPSSLTAAEDEVCPGDHPVG
ncbi:MAG: hypothetical protein WC052_05650 [Patescibacteria group bacterium]